jgi:hypothetical protein
MTTTTTPSTDTDGNVEDHQQNSTPISWIALATLPLAVGVMLQWRHERSIFGTRSGIWAQFSFNKTAIGFPSIFGSELVKHSTFPHG